MRFKQKTALLLAGIMLVGSVGMMNPTEVKAAGESNTFTLTVPADTSITKSGWNDIGSVGVSNVSIAADKKISVTIGGGATGRTLKKTGDESKTVGYVIKKGNAETNVEFGTSLDFTANGTQAIGADVADFSSAEVGTYEDTINFTAALASAAQGVEYTLTGSNANSKKLTSTALLESTSKTTFTYDGTTYTAYNGYISETSFATWNDGVGFVAALNAKEIDGRTGGWTLLTSKEMAYAWWLTTDPAANKGASSFGGVNSVWSLADSDGAGSYWDCYDASNDAGSVHAWRTLGKGYSGAGLGFVILRAAPVVTYDRTDGKGTLSSADLGTPATLNVNGQTYYAYNEFISKTSGSSWNDAMNFVAKLNEVEYGGYKDWMLINDVVYDGSDYKSAIGTAWRSQYYDSTDRGGVNCLWSSVASGGSSAFFFTSLGSWLLHDKFTPDTYCGFLVLRGPSN